MVQEHKKQHEKWHEIKHKDETRTTQKRVKYDTRNDTNDTITAKNWLQNESKMKTKNETKITQNTIYMPGIQLQYDTQMAPKRLEDDLEMKLQRWN